MTRLTRNNLVYNRFSLLYDNMLMPMVLDKPHRQDNVHANMCSLHIINIAHRLVENNLHILLLRMSSMELMVIHAFQNEKKYIRKQSTRILKRRSRRDEYCLPIEWTRSHWMIEKISQVGMLIMMDLHSIFSVVVMIVLVVSCFSSFVVSFSTRISDDKNTQ